MKKGGQMDHFKMFIDGQFVEARSGKTMTCIDPGTGQPIATVPSGDAEDADAAVKAARRAFDSGVWSGLSHLERCERVTELANLIEMDMARLVMCEGMNSGGTTMGAGGAIFGSAWTLRNIAWYAANQFPWREEVPMTANFYAQGRDYLVREPVGVCAGIIPWNQPFMVAIMKIAGAICMGNTLVIKPASDTPVSALLLAEAIAKSRIPKGVVNIVTGPGGTLGEALASHPDVDKVSFTGSVEVGKRIMHLCGDTVKKVTLELGGKSANIVLDDANIDMAVDGAVMALFFHSGQICVAGSRLLLARGIHDEFVQKLKKRVAEIKVNYQLLPDTNMGPLVSKRQLEKVEGYVAIGKSEGAHLLCGGKRLNLPGFEGGFYFEPTIFTNVNNRMRIAREEIFGPVLCVIPFESDAEAIAIANDTTYGLAGAVWSRDIARAEKVAARIKAGTMWINDYSVLADFLPFGGYKQSGVGREMGRDGLAEYTQLKRVHVSASGHADRLNFSAMINYPKGGVQTYQFHVPGKVLIGPGSISNLHREIQRLGGKRAVIITDEGLEKAGVLDLVKKAAGDFCVGALAGVEPDPDDDVIDRTIRMCRELRADIIVSLGGGSSMDTAKVTAAALTNGGTAGTNMSLARYVTPQMPHIAVPTTHGTGSEVSSSATITDKKHKRKFHLAEQALIPNTAILDATLTVGLPKKLSAATAMDAMSHAYGAITQTANNPVGSAIALGAVRLIAKYLPRVAENGHDLEARQNLLVASMMAIVAMNNTGMAGIEHGLGHTIGALFDIHHGTACGIALPHAIRFNRDYCLKETVAFAEALGVDVSGLTDVEAADAAADAVTNLMKRTGLPTTMREVGVPEGAFDQILMGAMTDLANRNNARPVNDPAALAEMIKAAF